MIPISLPADEAPVVLEAAVEVVLVGFVAAVELVHTGVVVVDIVVVIVAEEVDTIHIIRYCTGKLIGEGWTGIGYCRELNVGRKS
jgi:hypothetical protein